MINIDFGIPHDSIVLTNSQDEFEFSVDKILSLKREFDSINYPFEVELHLTGKCFLRCNGCSYYTRRNVNELNMENIKCIFNSVRKMKTETLFFSGGGDPLGWNNWKELVKNKREIIPNVKMGISTNFILYDPSLFPISFFDHYQIHIVGYNQISCIENTGVDCFNKINDNLLFLSDNYDRVVFKILITKKNSIKDIYNYLNYISQFPVKTVILKFEQNFLKNQRVDHNNLIQQVANLIPNHIISSKYQRIFSTFYDIMNIPDFPNRCYIVEQNFYALIRENGDIFPCVASTYDNNNSIGNVKMMPIDQLYDSEIFDRNKFTSNMLEKKCPLYACRHYRFNYILEKKCCKKEINIPLLI